MNELVVRKVSEHKRCDGDVVTKVLLIATTCNTKSWFKIAEGIEENRYYCSSNNIDDYSGILEPFFLSYNIPSCFVFNVDEEGHDENVDSKETDLLVVPETNTQKLFHPIDRKSDHTKFVA